MPSNLETVQAMYYALDRGDISFILSFFADNIEFEIKKLLDGGDSVVVWLSVKFTYKPTGKAFEDTYCLSIWEFDADGKVLKYTQAEDTHGLWIAQGGK
ncbi:hypothetical protein JKP88DRAFT_274887 [Tribonema minus]|uniref:SnoaL-like domain-containing protein n=1 Tax=Tribonema minus TaxID=303371 RepID=A0A835ZDU1_9STRA|nr:hypothetical protein JKP88DRAFT_274887 [Tribonema minus]